MPRFAGVEGRCARFGGVAARVGLACAGCARDPREGDQRELDRRGKVVADEDCPGEGLVDHDRVGRGGDGER